MVPSSVIVKHSPTDSGAERRHQGDDSTTATSHYVAVAKDWHPAVYEVVIVGDSGDQNDAVRSLLHTTLTHVAEFQIRMLEVIGAKFGLKIEDMVEAIRDSQEFATKTLAKEVIQSEIVEKILKTKKGKRVIIKKE